MSPAAFDQRAVLHEAIGKALMALAAGKPPNLVRWDLTKRILAATGWPEPDVKVYVANCWPELERQGLRKRPAPKLASIDARLNASIADWLDDVPSVPSPTYGDPMKILNPLAAAGAKALPAPAPVAETPPPTPAEPKPKPAKGDLAAILAAALAGHLPSADLDEARVIALIREHSIAPPAPGLTLVKPDQEPVKYDKPVHAYAPLLLALIDAKVPTYLWSGSGTSKTRLVEACAEMLKLTYYSDSYTRGMGRAEILGFRDARGEPVETQLSQAFAKGGLYLADEGDADGIGIIALNRALANDHAVFAGRLIPKHPDFRLCFAANTPGTGQANGYRREPIDAALLDRLFVVELPVDECLEHQAAGIGGRVPKAPKCDLAAGGKLDPEEWAKIIHAYRDAAKELAIGTPLTTSGRPLWIGAHLARRGIGREWLISGLIRKSRPDDAWNPWHERAQGNL